VVPKVVRNNEEIRKLAAEAEGYQRMQNSLREQIVSVNMSSMESAVAINSIEKIKGGESSLVSLGSGIYVKANLEKRDKILIEMGSGIYGEVEPEKAIETLKKRIEDNKNYSDKLEAEMKKIKQSLTDLETKAREFLQ
jgi:prefoldin alpha subunit